jgi:hypothetical protein
VKIDYGPWERGMLRVTVDGEFAGYLSEDADGWAFWRALEGKPTRYEMTVISPTRNKAVADGVGKADASS